jgi:hypothetical protein
MDGKGRVTGNLGAGWTGLLVGPSAHKSSKCWRRGEQDSDKFFNKIRQESTHQIRSKSPSLKYHHT